MARDTTWSIDGTTANGCTSRPPTIQPGRTVQLRFWFGPDASIGTGYEARHQAVLDLLEYANGQPVVTGLTDTGVPWYREEVPGEASISTFVVKMEPGTDISRATGFWGILTGGRDATSPAGDRRWVEVEVFVLAPVGDHADKSAVESAFGTSIL